MMKFKIIIISCIAFLLMFSCNKNSSSEKKIEEKQIDKKEIVRLTKDAVKEIKIEITEVIEGELTGEIKAPAKLIPNQDLEAYSGSLLQGRVSRVLVKIGDNVRKGQTLMFIEGLQIGEIKSQFLKAKANLSYAEANFSRLKTLIDQNVGSQKSYLEAKAEFEKAKAEFSAEDKKIHSIGLTDNDIEGNKLSDEHTAGSLAVNSPIDGTIVERNVVIGQLVDANSNSFKIINTSSLLADAQIYENDLNRISGKPDIIIATSAYSDRQFKGKIIYISDVLDKETRTFKVRATVPNQDKKLKPEMFAEMLIPTGKPGKAMLVPAGSVIKDGNEQYLFVAVNDTTFEKRIIKLGKIQGDKIEIISGVNKGEKIACKEVFMLKSELKKALLGAGD